jgi:hypothetical protein
VSRNARPMKCPMRGRQPGHHTTPAFTRERARWPPTPALLPRTNWGCPTYRPHCTRLHRALRKPCPARARGAEIVLSARLAGAGPGACSPRNAGTGAVSMWMSGVGVAAGFQMSCARGALVEPAVLVSESPLPQARSLGVDVARTSPLCGGMGAAAGLEHASGGDLVVSPLDPARTGPASGAGSLERRRVAQAVAKLRPCHPNPHDERGTEGPDRLFDRDAADMREGHVDHWKISVVQSPPWRRTSCARAGPPGRSLRSTKKSGSSSIPPSGLQFTRSSQERRSG